ncbi:MAG: sugar phosphate isomerase/epimerase [Planctomycetes bacterium]|nr:sugar phosphate isomerase/epimerase [Planctomycetota bacterium]
MRRIRLAIPTRLYGLPLKAAIRAAADARADGVQFDLRNEVTAGDLSSTGRRQLLHALDEVGLVAGSAAFPTRRAYYDPTELEGRIAGTKAAMQLAWDLGLKVLNIRPGRVPEDTASQSWQNLRDVLNDLARHGNRVGVIPAVTAGRDDLELLATLLEAVTEGPIGVNFDPATFLLSGSEPAAAFRRLHSFVEHVTVRDALREMDGGVEVAVGRGEVAWDELLALLDEAGYAGWLTADRTTGDDKPGDAARAIQYIRTVAAGG